MTIAELLVYQKWAVVGDVLNEQKYAFEICQALEKEGYQVVRVNPRSRQAGIYRNLAEIPGEIQVLDLVIHPKLGLAILAQALALGLKGVVIQPGAESQEILDFCAQHQIQPLKGCVLQALEGADV